MEEGGQELGKEPVGQRKAAGGGPSLHALAPGTSAWSKTAEKKQRAWGVARHAEAEGERAGKAEPGIVGVGMGDKGEVVDRPGHLGQARARQWMGRQVEEGVGQKTKAEPKGAKPIECWLRVGGASRSEAGPK